VRLLYRSGGGERRFSLMNRRWGLILAAALGLMPFGVSSRLRFWIEARTVTDVWRWGFPFPFYETWGPCPGPEPCRSFSALLLLADLGAWCALCLSAYYVLRRLRRR
jgi:hypothetical protein